MGLLRYSVELYKTLAARLPRVRQRPARDDARTGVDEFHHAPAMAELRRRPGRGRRAGARRASCTRWSIGGRARGGVPADRRARRPEQADATRSSQDAGRSAILRHTPVTALERPRRRLGARDARRATSGQGSSSTRPASGRRRSRGWPGADLPIAAMQHHYVVTDPIAEVGGAGARAAGPPRPGRAPSTYRQEGGGLLVGPFERNPRPWALDGIPRLSRAAPAARPRPSRNRTRGRSRASARLRHRRHQDGRQRPRRLHARRPLPDGAACRACAISTCSPASSIFGIVFAGGAGRYAAEWIVDGQPSDNMWELDVRRFGEYAHVAVVPRCAGDPRSTHASTRSTTRRRSATPDGR